MDDLENSIYDCPCEKNFCPETDVSVNRQQMMLSQPELWTHRKTEASLRVLTTVMLHTWRQRRKEVRELQEVVQRLQYSSMKYKNELHVYGTLMRVEQKRNRELQVQLKQSAMSIDQVRSSCELLASSVRNLTTEKIQLQSDLEQRSQEYGQLEEMSGQTQKLLATAHIEQSNLRRQLTNEQRTSQHLQRENEGLIKEVVLAEGREAKYRQVRDWYHRELAEKEKQIRAQRRDISELEERLLTIRKQTGELEQLRESAERMTAQTEELRQELSRSRTSFFSVLGEPSSRLSLRRLHSHVLAPFQESQLWVKFRRYSSNVMYLFCLYMLPGVRR
ncbi:cingulin isoform X2 [Drosophila biarmipes]|uniref:cingulin isoform X2 n=1 Tax=Drosophila biarmipes TaxID=125945 RepID=UPI0007E79682|nr:cingulin isoform X2 [Drosophila biarmipes]